MKALQKLLFATAAILFASVTFGDGVAYVTDGFAGRQFNPIPNGLLNQCFVSAGPTAQPVWGACPTPSGVVSTTGSPASGELAKFSGAATLTNGNLSGDCTTSNTLAVTCLQTNGVNFAASATTDTTNAANIASGTLGAARLPAFTGDMTTSAGSAATSVVKVNGNTPGGSCTNQVVTSIDSSGRPTCATVTSSKVDTSIANTSADINTSSQVTSTHLASGLPINQGGLGQNSAAASGQVPKATSTTASAWTTPSLATFNTVVAGPLTSNDSSEGTSNTTLTADSNFTVTVPSAGRYQLTIFLIVSEATSGAGGFKSDNSTGTATIGDIEAMFFYYCTSGTSGQLPVAGTSGTATAGSCSTVNTSTTAPTGFITTGQINFTSAGTFGLRWAQNSSSANTTSIQTGSYLMLQRIL